MRKLFRKIKSKAVLVAMLVSVLTVSVVSSAMAVGVADDSVTTSFGTISDNAQATMASVALKAIIILGVILAWKYGKKIFNRVAN